MSALIFLYHGWCHLQGKSTTLHEKDVWELSPTMQSRPLFFKFTDLRFVSGPLHEQNVSNEIWEQAQNSASPHHCSKFIWHDVNNVFYKSIVERVLTSANQIRFCADAHQCHSQLLGTILLEVCRGPLYGLRWYTYKSAGESSLKLSVNVQQKKAAPMRTFMQFLHLSVQY